MPADGLRFLWNLPDFLFEKCCLYMSLMLIQYLLARDIFYRDFKMMLLALSTIDVSSEAYLYCSRSLTDGFFMMDKR